MKIFNDIIGNIYEDKELENKISRCEIEYLNLDQWTAQKSRFIMTGDRDTRCAVSLKRHRLIVDGDVLEYEPVRKFAIVAKVDLSPVLVIDLSEIERKDKPEIVSACIELGHAIGNQHWPAVVKGTEVFIPLTVDKKVMESVMETHHFDGISYKFMKGREVIPYLAPHEVRRLFGGASQESHSHDH
ncbi:MAG: urease accessory protein UreE [Muribaculaceae bacterium]|nr:urease accessory protein UreE [Muribaculaceae bacterium]